LLFPKEALQLSQQRLNFFGQQRGFLARAVGFKQEHDK
jgi:hypothetical protein